MLHPPKPSFHELLNGDRILIIWFFRYRNPGNKICYDSPTSGQHQTQSDQPYDYRINIKVLSHTATYTRNYSVLLRTIELFGHVSLTVIECIAYPKKIAIGVDYCSFCTYAGDIGKKIHIHFVVQLLSVRLFAISKDAIDVSAYHYAL